MPTISPFTGVPSAVGAQAADELLLVQATGATPAKATRRATLGQVGEALAPRVLARKSVTLTAPASAERIALFFTEAATTVAALHAAVAGGAGASVAFHLRFGPDMDAAGTALVTAGTLCPAGGAGLTIAAFDAGSITANSWVWLDVGTVTGDVAAFHATLAF